MLVLKNLAQVFQTCNNLSYPGSSLEREIEIVSLFWALGDIKMYIDNPKFEIQTPPWNSKNVAKLLSVWEP